jgi:hypothetical protein
MNAITERLRTLQDRWSRRRADMSTTKLERAQKKARAEAQRREHQREDMDSKIHRK